VELEALEGEHEEGGGEDRGADEAGQHGSEAEEQLPGQSDSGGWS